MTDITYYTFIYCFYHDDGYIYKSNKIYSDYKSYCGTECGTECGSGCELSLMGILSYNGINIYEKLKINKCYDIYNEEFKFEYYFKNIIDDNNNNLDINECIELKNYFTS